MFVKVNIWTLGQAYKVHGKEIKNEKPKTGEFRPVLKWYILELIKNIYFCPLKKIYVLSFLECPDNSNHIKVEDDDFRYFLKCTTSKMVEITCFWIFIFNFFSMYLVGLPQCPKINLTNTEVIKLSTHP